MHPVSRVAWVLLAALAAGGPAHVQAQSSAGELRVQVEDAQGRVLPSQVLVASDAAQVHEQLATNAAGALLVQHLPYGTYLVRAEHRGFATLSRAIDVHTAMPLRLTLKMQPVGTPESVRVNADTLLEHDTAGTVNRIGRAQIADREASLPGRGLVDLIDSEPGWLYEGNAVLHPRGSEYQTQFVVDGIPLTENRSPGFGSQIEAADVQSAAVYTAGIPAEYGRKMGGVIEVNTLRNVQPGLHGETVLSGGSFATANGFSAFDYGWGRNSAGVSASGAMTDWYENPPVLQNYTNNGTTGDFSGNYEREWTQRDRMTLTARHELAHFLVPNEQVQENTGQRQDRSTLETMGTAAWQHILGPTALTDVTGMVRDDTVLLGSNALSTPIIASQDRGFREGYIKASGTKDWKRQEWKAGFEGDFLHVHEGFADTITDPSEFDAGTPGSFQFFEPGSDREEAGFLEDTARFNHWTLAAGLRRDDYSFVVHRKAWSPRLALSRYLARAAMTAHVSYDRVFQTPAFENLLLSSSKQVVSLDPQVLREPVLPSTGNYYETGISKAIANTLRVDANVYLRRFQNFADDNPLLDTSISFPIAFRRASIYGAEGKMTVPRWWRLSGYASYSYMVATCNLPVTGGLFLGDQASQALDQLQGRLWISQDQRNTLRTRWTAHLPRGFWVASGAQFGSGLPVDFDGTREQALAQYGPSLVDRVNFTRGRVEPSLAFDASAGAEWPVGDRLKMRLQVDGENLNNRINLIDFAGLFSGNAVEPPRSGDITLAMRF
ncbi:MAG TPA: TonB-dependent receptor [Acidobacteriaceae bacterium]|jgi:outer membrane cobalamin receptor|nr:TonB-dependent receptor [Acidobacteriaceae bacterium]